MTKGYKQRSGENMIKLKFQNYFSEFTFPLYLSLSLSLSLSLAVSNSVFNSIYNYIKNHIHYIYIEKCTRSLAADKADGLLKVGGPIT